METTIESLGPCQIVSPLTHNSFEVNFRADSERVLYNHLTETQRPEESQLSFELAGPRERLAAS